MEGSNFNPHPLTGSWAQREMRQELEAGREKMN